MATHLRTTNYFSKTTFYSQFQNKRSINLVAKNDVVLVKLTLHKNEILPKHNNMGWHPKRILITIAIITIMFGKGCCISKDSTFFYSSAFPILFFFGKHSFFSSFGKREESSVKKGPRKTKTFCCES